MAKHAISPLAPAGLAELPPIAGVRLAAGQAGIRYKDRTDLLLVELAEGTVAAGVFTRSKAPSAPVDWCRSILSEGKARALVVNSGNANAFTGKRGVTAVDGTVQAAARAVGCKPRDVWLASTGVIGEPLPFEKIEAALPSLKSALKDDAWEQAARAIMTTDTFPKAATRELQIGDKQVTINGIAKGSGMIAPDMATMLAFVFTDADIPQNLLQSMLQQSTDKSFNATTVDGDTSTSDTALLFATGQGAKITADEVAVFQRALDSLMIELAQLIVKDGEGAQKFITINVQGAESNEAARRIGLTIGNSPLVKTAIAGEDANWGRIVAAIGKSGEMADRDLLSIAIGGVVIAKDGERVTGYDEAPVTAHMKTREIVIDVNLNIASGAATVWTCDLTHGYIDINADYRS
jgi:glutamate N-acetyltransferase/amino-acid N-acetyltransferase